MFSSRMQFVYSQQLQKLYRVNQGSGMGQVLSRDVADGVFFSLCEDGHASRPIVKENSCIHLYVRYRDDILVCFSGMLKVPLSNLCKR